MVQKWGGAPQGCERARYRGAKPGVVSMRRARGAALVPTSTRRVGGRKAVFSGMGRHEGWCVSQSWSQWRRISKWIGLFGKGIRGRPICMTRDSGMWASKSWFWDLFVSVLPSKGSVVGGLPYLGCGKGRGRGVDSR